MTEQLITDKESVKSSFEWKNIGLAFMGGMALAQDEMEKFVQKLIKRGEEAEQNLTEPKKKVKEMIERGCQMSKDMMATVADNLNIEKALAKMNIPTRNDIEDLAKKVDHLAEKVETLEKG